MYEWFGWAALLVVQNATFTLVSRARNSKSIAYHALAAVGSNGVWFVSQFLLFGYMLNVLKDGTWVDALPIGLWYTLWTIVGSVGMHWIALHKIEKGRNV
jgi:hypothetical protein